MKYVILIWVLWVAGCLGTHAQTITVLTEQLIALQELQHTVQQGYRLVTGGLQTIGQITNSEFQLHSAYFGSLSEVNPVLDNDPKLTALRNLQSTLIQQINAALDYWRKQPSLQPQNNE
jgi:hypothetical protein